MKKNNVISIVEKPWGREELLEHNDFYVVKRLTMFQGHQCSLQYHEKKLETVYVLSGSLGLIIGDDPSKLEMIIMKPNDSITIPVNMIHRMKGITDTVYLESSTPQLDDVIRIQDDYKRV